MNFHQNDGVRYAAELCRECDRYKWSKPPVSNTGTHCIIAPSEKNAKANTTRRYDLFQAVSKFILAGRNKINFAGTSAPYWKPYRVVSPHLGVDPIAEVT